MNWSNSSTWRSRRKVPLVIRVFIDREGGVRLGDCESFSRKFGAILEVEDPVRAPTPSRSPPPG